MNKLSTSQDEFLHHKLPIDKDEQILAVFRHHPIAYILPILIAFLMIGILVGLAFALMSPNLVGGNPIIDPAYQNYVVIGVGIFAFLVLLFTYMPVWIKLQDQLVLTDESLLQMLQTSLFSDKVSQLSLQHVADVTVRAGFWGNLFGYGHITVETPGEQDNYEYDYLPDPGSAARLISEAHENFIAALESGRMHTDFRNADLNSPRMQAMRQNSGQAQIVVDHAQYQAFLDYQRKEQTILSQQNPSEPKP